MNRKTLIIGFLSIAFLFLLETQTKAQTYTWKLSCVVADTSGTPLNVRRDSDGRVVAKLKNGTRVRVTEMSEGGDIDGDNPSSSKVSVRRKGKWVVLGWVASKYLKCDKQ